MFLTNEWKLLDEAMKAGDAAAAQKAFLAERQACLACHVAEGMAFLNNTPIFSGTRAFK
jgi:mono/diheme cytochrome c family protein